MYFFAEGLPVVKENEARFSLHLCGESLAPQLLRIARFSAFAKKARQSLGAQFLPLAVGAGQGKGAAEPFQVQAEDAAAIPCFLYAGTKVPAGKNSSPSL